MHTTEDPGSEGLSRSDTSDAERQRRIPRIQDPNWGTSTASKTPHDTVKGNELPDLRSEVERAISTNYVTNAFGAPFWQPRPYQVRGVDWLLRPESALFLPPGLGKTAMGLAAIIMLKKMKLNYRTLVLAPKTVCVTTWITEPKKWAQFQGLKVGFAWGPDSRERILKDNSYDVVVMNYDGLVWAAPILAQGHNFGVLLCDEITRLKNTQSKRFKIIKPLLASFTFRWGFTGTPCANGLLDLFGQVYILDQGKRLGRYITHFRFAYFHQLPYDKFRYFISPKRQEELVAKIKDLAMYVDEKEWLDLPELFHIPLKINLEIETRKKYDSLETDYILKVNDGVVTAANAGVLTSKLRQVTGGAVYTESPVWEEVGTEKLDRLESLVEEMAGEPLIVAYLFEHELIRLKKKYPNALVIKGGMSPKAVQITVTQWNSGNAPLMFVQPASTSLGLNLQFGGAAICWFSITYNLEDFIQQVKRLHRSGQKRIVRNYMLLATKTIDERVSDILTRKNATQDDVNAALKFKM
jgi:SNF2 family DNA or RNA helicase